VSWSPNNSSLICASTKFRLVFFIFLVLCRRRQQLLIRLRWSVETARWGIYENMTIRWSLKVRKTKPYLYNFLVPALVYSFGHSNLKSTRRWSNLAADCAAEISGPFLLQAPLLAPGAPMRDTTDTETWPCNQF
jgi:hypothetical protein